MVSALTGSLSLIGTDGGSPYVPEELVKMTRFTLLRAAHSNTCMLP